MYWNHVIARMQKTALEYEVQNALEYEVLQGHCLICRMCVIALSDTEMKLRTNSLIRETVGSITTVFELLSSFPFLACQ